MTSTLDKLGQGDRARITNVGGDGVLAQRMLALGLLPGEQVHMIGVAPMGDPLTVELSSGRVSLRKSEAAVITITQTDTTSSTPPGDNTG